MNEGVALCVEADPDRIRRRLETRYLDEVANSLDDAVERALQAKRESRPLSIGVEGNAAEAFPELLDRGVSVDVVTDQTSAHDPTSYIHLCDWAWDTPTRPDQWWVADFTYVWTLAGFCYVALLTDVFPRGRAAHAAPDRPPCTARTSWSDQHADRRAAPSLEPVPRAAYDAAGVLHMTRPV